MKSIKQVSKQVEQDLQRYIEANYHLHHERLLEERKQLMNTGETSTEPWVEATPTYESGKRFSDLGLPQEVVDILKDLEDEDDNLDIYDPPYKHQADALQSFFNDKKDLIVSTGTGSGKTEIFLYSILGKLAQEAKRNETTQKRGIRTLVLYPMNALVADQLARMRQLFGNKKARKTIADRMDRTVQFGMYTGRTPYHGEFDVDKNRNRLAPVIDRYLNLQNSRPDLYEELNKMGRIPAKDLEGYRNKGALRETQFRTQPGDAELYSRQEMHGGDNEHGGIPDILITNYSMLEYMLLRPIEQPFFEKTKSWLEADEANELNIVLDEAHLYRGAQGAEVGLLLSRLLQKLDISRNRVRYILTSATMGDNIEQAAPEFAAQLTAGEEDDFAVIKGSEVSYPAGSPATERTARLLETVEYTLSPAKIRNFAAERGWETYDGSSTEQLRKYLASQLQSDELFAQAHEHLQEAPLKLSELANHLFEDMDSELAEEATGNFLYLCTEARTEEDQSLLPARLHMFLKGLPRQFACVNPDCSERRATEGERLLGRFYTNPREECDCGGRVFELLSHRTCGAAYLRAFRRENNTIGPTFLWSQEGQADSLEEIHLCVEEPRSDERNTAPKRKLDISTGHLVKNKFVDHDCPEQYIEVRTPPDDPPSDDLPRSWTHCPVCGIDEQWHDGRTKIMDLETKGEEPFANIVRSMFEIQPKDPEKEKLPNEGKKVLCFSDGRQKAARLARDVQANVETDSFREVIADIVSNKSEPMTMDRLFEEFVIYCHEHNIVYFDDSDEYITNDGVVYEGSRSVLQNLVNNLEQIKELYGLDEVSSILDHSPARDQVSEERVRQFDSTLLKSLGGEYFSIPAALIGYLRPVSEGMENIQAELSDVDDSMLEAVVIETLWQACQERAYDPDINPSQRTESARYEVFREADEGLKFDELLPDNVINILSEHLSDEEQHRLRIALISESGPFAAAGGMRHMIDPSKVTLELKLDDNWYRCNGCYQFTAVSFDDRCPRKDCGGTVEAVSSDDPHLEARKSFLREPPRQVVQGERDVFTLRSEEHSAQLTAKDNSDAMSRSEEYELLFQDILVGSETEQPIDVLSCTTTMEVGIDIGSLTGVAMRTVPPAPENYEQRAGRAGRRGTGLSTIFTFADNSPHETRYFNEPGDMISDSGTEPIIYAGNAKIAKRHVNACLIARFFDASDIKSGASVFESLGTGAEFFTTDGKYTHSSFDSWVQENVLSSGGSVSAEIGALLPEELGKARSDSWRIKFVREAADDFLDELNRLSRRGSWDLETNSEENLLSVLLDRALLPTFSFPIDVCDFVVKGESQDTQRPKTRYEMSRDMKQALSTYVPGREIVVDKKTFESYGVFFRFAEDQINRGSHVEWHELQYLNFCPVCETVFDTEERHMAAEDEPCAVCNESDIVTVQKFTPPAFAPEINQQNQPEQSEYGDEERVYATPPKYPLTPTSEGAEESDSLKSKKSIGLSTVGKINDEKLIVANLGPDDEGFRLCTECGAVGTDELSNPHNRPYPKDVARMDMSEYTPQCSGNSITTSFSHSFPSDLTVMRIPLKSPLRFAPDTKWFESAAQSLAEALVIAASKTLGIEDDELEGGFRTRSADLVADDDANGLIELFLFDTTPGGAGFSAKVYDEFNAVVETANQILNQCECESACHKCLRRYDNRHLHGSLNRHLGKALLTYAKTEELPTLDTSRTESLIMRLTQSLQLKNSQIELMPVSGQKNKWSVSGHSRSLTLSTHSCLRIKPINTDTDLAVSDYQLANELPEIAAQIAEEIK